MLWAGVYSAAAVVWINAPFGESEPRSFCALTAISVY